MGPFVMEPFVMEPFVMGPVLMGPYVDVSPELMPSNIWDMVEKFDR